MNNREIIKNFISIVLATICYFSICRLNILYAYNVFSWIVYAILIIIFCKTDLFNKENRKYNIVLTILLSIILVYGQFAYRYMSDYSVNILKQLFTRESIKMFMLYMPLVYMLLCNIVPFLKKINLVNGENNNKKCYKLFFVCAILIFICWLPYLLCYYPGTLSPDSLGELSIVINKFSSVSDHHPILHILFIGGFYNIGYLFTHSITHAIAFVSITQMLIMASIFAYVIVFLKKRSVNKYILLLVFAFYAFFPMHGYYSITMWKDVLFAGMFTLLVTQFIKITELENQRKIRVPEAIIFGIISVLCVFFRNNAIYMYVLCTLLIPFFLRRNKKAIGITSILVIVLYIIVKGPVFNAFNISKSASAEYIGMPLQQIGRIVAKDGKMSNAEKQKINELIPLETIKTAYNPVVSDGIKFNKEYKGEVFDNDKIGYLKLWLSLIIKNPSIAIEAYSISTLGYYYPGVEYWSVSNIIWDNEYNIKVHNVLPSVVKTTLENLERRDMPIASIEWSIGLCIWTITLFALICIKKNGYRSTYGYLPALGIWITMVVASPVFGEFRYVYCLFTSLPLLISIPYLNNIKIETSKKIKNGKIIINNVKKKDNTIEVDYEVSNNLKCFFNLENKFKVDYYENIEKVPNSIAVIPFISNVLPIIWLTKSTLYVSELDEDYYNSIPNTMSAFNELYKTKIFNGNVKVDKIIKNVPLKGKKNVSVFCSGGVDSTLSVKEALQVSKSPLLITIWGTDVWESDADGWKTLHEYSSSIGNNLNLNNLYIKTNFRKFIFEHELTKQLLSGKIDDSWWRGIQHGMGLLGHVAPLVYLKNITTHFIPATLNSKNIGSTCGSFPTIDQSVKYCGCNIIHSGYEYTRIEKVKEITNYFKSKDVKLRVCYQEKGELLNCCHCEKCYLTIMEIVANGENPRDWGFDISDKEISKIPTFLKEHASNSPINIEIWDDIIKTSYGNIKKIKNNPNYEWILDYHNQREDYEYEQWKAKNIK